MSHHYFQANMMFILANMVFMSQVAKPARSFPP